jgi:hypothetical protein
VELRGFEPLTFSLRRLGSACPTRSARSEELPIVRSVHGVSDLGARRGHTGGADTECYFHLAGRWYDLPFTSVTTSGSWLPVSLEVPMWKDAGMSFLSSAE